MIIFDLPRAISNPSPFLPHLQEKQKFQLRAARFANSVPPHSAQPADKVESVCDQSNTAEQEEGQEEEDEKAEEG